VGHRACYAVTDVSIARAMGGNWMSLSLERESSTPELHDLRFQRGTRIKRFCERSL
jgi:hypothetical protein